MTLRQAVALATDQLVLRPALSDSAHRDSEFLLLHLLGIDRATLLAHPDRMLTPAQVALYEAAIARRLRHEPIQYITGEQEFFGLRLKVTPSTLIPRPETEHLVEAVLDRLPRDQPVKILDIGTGTGAIALALAVHLATAHITAVDLSGGALEVARQNAAVHHLEDRVHFIQSDLLTELPQREQTAAFDAIVSNPPYIAEGDRAQLHPQVRDHEPPEALFAGATGLDIYRRLIPKARAALKLGGFLALEIGHGQKEAIAELLGDWPSVGFIDDLQQIPRVVIAWR